MLTAVSLLHILVAIALVLIVLLQTGRGSEIGAAFGSGASQTLFGSSGTSGFMTRLTTIVVIVFMLTSVVLALMYSKGRMSSSVRPQSAPMEQSVPVPAAPVAPSAPAPAK
jgi:preprotein translocase subunit SecG